MNYKLAAILIIGGALTVASPALPDAPTAPAVSPHTLKDINAELRTGERRNAAELVAAGVSILQGPSRPPVSDETTFLTQFSNVETGTFKNLNARAEEERLFAVLAEKHKDEPDALIHLFVEEGGYYLNVVNDRVKEREVLAKAEELSIAQRIDQAILRLKLLNELAETYFANPDPANEEQDRQRGRTLFNEVLSFPVTEEPFFHSKRLADFEALYTEAAERMVENSTLAELRQMHFQPFVWMDLHEAFHDKAKYLNNLPPDSARFFARLRRYLQRKIQDEKDQPIVEHLKAVLASLPDV